MASLIRQPPDSSLTIFSVIISGVNPTASKHGFTSAAFASSVDACDVMNARMVCSKVTSTSCCTKTHLMSLGNPLMSPAARRVNSVVLPAPFCPTIPYRRPRSSFSDVGLSSTFPANARMIPSRSRQYRFAADSDPAPSPPTSGFEPASSPPPPRWCATAPSNRDLIASSPMNSASIGPAASTNSSAISRRDLPGSPSARSSLAMSATYSVTSSSTAPGWADASASFMCLITSDAPISGIALLVPSPPAPASQCAFGCAGKVPSRLCATAGPTAAGGGKMAEGVAEPSPRNRPAKGGNLQNNLGAPGNFGRFHIYTISLQNARNKTTLGT